MDKALEVTDALRLQQIVVYVMLYMRVGTARGVSHHFGLEMRLRRGQLLGREAAPPQQLRLLLLVSILQQLRIADLLVVGRL